KEQMVVSAIASTPHSSASSPLDMTFHITAWVTFNETHEVLEFDMAPNGSQHYRVD
ncbi:GPW/gp25 family protein, partial [Shigella sonnei]|uniref:hypothetical protein n=1 Tax=Shigella sonnei TaxID=624 RepID=UPI00209301B5